MADATIDDTQILATGSNPGFLATAGEVIPPGCTVYHKKSLPGQQWFKAVGSDPTQMPVAKDAPLGFSLNAALAAGMLIQILKTPDQNVRIGAHGLPVGTPLFQSENAGKMCQLADIASGHVSLYVGRITDATHMTFNPDGIGSVKP